MFGKGEPKYNSLVEVRKEAEEDGILKDKKASEADRQLGSLTVRHDELQKRLDEKEEK